MADLGDAGAELSQPVLLAQRRGELRLHRLKRGFGLSQLAQAGARRDDPARILGRVGIALDLPHHPLDREHEKGLHRREEQGRRHHRDHRRQDQDAQAVIEHLGAQRRLVHRHLDQQPALLHGISDYADDPLPGAGQRAQRVADQRQRRDLAQIIGRMDRLGQRRGQRKLTHLVAPEHDVVDARVLQKLGLQSGVERVGGQQRQRGDLRTFEPQLQVVLPKPRHRRYEDQHLGQHHENRGQGKKAS